VAAGDLCCVLYNPRSKGRPDLLRQALDILSQGRGPDVPVAAVRAAGCPEEAVTRGRIADFPVEVVDMRTLVVVGDSTTRWGARGMITPRGYVEKYGA